MRLIFLFIYLILVSDLQSQSLLPYDSSEQKVVFREIVEVDTSLKAAVIYTLAKEWFSANSKTFNRSNADKSGDVGAIVFGIQKGNANTLTQLYKNDQPLKLQDSEERKLMGKGVTKYTGSSMGCVRIVYLEYDIKVWVKDAKYKVEITNLNYTHYNQTSMQQSVIYGLSDGGNCGSKNPIENLLNCQRCKSELEKYYKFLETDMALIITDLKDFVKKNQKKNDKW